MRQKGTSWDPLIQHHWKRRVRQIRLSKTMSSHVLNSSTDEISTVSWTYCYSVGNSSQKKRFFLVWRNVIWRNIGNEIFYISSCAHSPITGHKQRENGFIFSVLHFHTLIKSPWVSSAPGHVLPVLLAFHHQMLWALNGSLWPCAGVTPVYPIISAKDPALWMCLIWVELRGMFTWLAGSSLPNAAGGSWPSLLRVHCCSWSDWCPSICVVTAVNFSSLLWIKLLPKFSRIL